MLPPVQRVSILLGIIAIVALALGGLALLGRRSGDVVSYPLPLAGYAGYPEMVAVDPVTGRFFVPIVAGVSILDGETGAVVQTVPLTISPQWTLLDARARHVLVVGRQGIGLLDARTGAVVRTSSIALGPVAVALWARRDRAFVVDGPTNALRAIDARSAQLLPTVTVPLVPGPTAPNAVTVDERASHVFVTSPGNNIVSMVDGWTGTVLTTTVVAWSPGALAVDERVGHVFVATTGAYICASGLSRCGFAGIGVSMLDAHTGTLLHTTHIRGETPMAIAVDERTERAYVVTSARNATAQPSWTRRLLLLDARRGIVLRTQALDRTNVDPNKLRLHSLSTRAVAVSSSFCRATRCRAPAISRTPQRDAPRCSMHDRGPCCAPYTSVSRPPASQSTSGPDASSCSTPAATSALPIPGAGSRRDYVACSRSYRVHRFRPLGCPAA